MPMTYTTTNTHCRLIVSSLRLNKIVWTYGSTGSHPLSPLLHHHWLLTVPTHHRLLTVPATAIALLWVLLMSVPSSSTHHSSSRSRLLVLGSSTLELIKQSTESLLLGLLLLLLTILTLPLTLVGLTLRVIGIRR